MITTFEDTAARTCVSTDWQYHASEAVLESIVGSGCMTGQILDASYGDQYMLRSILRLVE